jgi:hypothetical protein
MRPAEACGEFAKASAEISHMKTNGMIGTGLLALLVGIAAPLYAQHDQKDDSRGHSEQKEAKHEARPHDHAQQQRPEQRQQTQHAEQQQRHDQNGQQDRSQDQAPQGNSRGQDHAQREERDQHTQPQHGQQRRQVRDDQRQRDNRQARNGPEQHRIQQSAWQKHRSQRWESDHRNWRQRGGYRGYRIPDDRFRGRFGPEHTFRIYGLPFMVYQGYPRFQYGGYWITAVDPWPEYWGEDWYDNDDVYVTYVDDGYYMYNRRYPTVGIAIRISM